MDRVKDITQIIISPESYIMKIHEKKSAVILLDGDESNAMAYGEIVAKNTDESDDINIGDIIIDFDKTSAFEWKGNKYAIIPKYKIRVAVKPDNFIKTNTLEN